MTRTERSVYPHALVKDRSVSKTGLDKALKKGGAGPHNWGNPLDYQGEATDNGDDLLADPLAETENKTSSDVPAESNNAPTGEMDQPSNNGPETSPVVQTKPMAMQDGRKMSMTEEEREKARMFRKGAMENDHVDLTSIARTSAAFSQSPPMEGGLSTSPVRNMNTLAKNMGKY